TSTPTFETAADAIRTFIELGSRHARSFSDRAIQPQGVIHQVSQLPNNFYESGNGFPNKLRLMQQRKPDIVYNKEWIESSSSINILIKSGIAKIADFGLSGQIGSLSLGDDTAAYRDPLSFRDQPYKHQKIRSLTSSVLGCCFGKFLVGKFPVIVKIVDQV
ncbi:1278_t:CDS:2, partial [Paraglomus occultum]